MGDSDGGRLLDERAPTQWKSTNGWAQFGSKSSKGHVLVVFLAAHTLLIADCIGFLSGLGTFV